MQPRSLQAFALLRLGRTSANPRSGPGGAEQLSVHLTSETSDIRFAHTEELALLRELAEHASEYFLESELVATTDGSRRQHAHLAMTQAKNQTIAALKLWRALPTRST